MWCWGFLVNQASGLHVYMTVYVSCKATNL